MAPQKDRVKPTHYPALPFHILRSAQLVSSVIVASIMSYFMRELSRDNYGIPWTFILLLTVSLLTLLSLTATIALHFLYGLNPVLNTVLNSALLILWAVSFGLLGWWSSGTLSHVCDMENWDDDMGISICRVYKALFSFALFGLLSTAAAVGLDVMVLRKSTVRGRFAAIKTEDVKRVDIGQERGMELRDVDVQGEENRDLLSGGRGGREGYGGSEERFGYGETGYSGAGGRF